jgi:hypothetical protein
MTITPSSALYYPTIDIPGDKWLRNACLRIRYRPSMYSPRSQPRERKNEQCPLLSTRPGGPNCSNDRAMVRGALLQRALARTRPPSRAQAQWVRRLAAWP